MNKIDPFKHHLKRRVDCPIVPEKEEIQALPVQMKNLKKLSQVLWQGKAKLLPKKEKFWQRKT